MNSKENLCHQPYTRVTTYHRDRRIPRISKHRPLYESNPQRASNFRKRAERLCGTILGDHAVRELEFAVAGSICVPITRWRYFKPPLETSEMPLFLDFFCHASPLAQLAYTGCSQLSQPTNRCIKYSNREKFWKLKLERTIPIEHSPGIGTLFQHSLGNYHSTCIVTRLFSSRPHRCGNCYCACIVSGRLSLSL